MKKLKMLTNQKLTFEEGYFTIGGFFLSTPKGFYSLAQRGVVFTNKKALLIDLKRGFLLFVGAISICSNAYFVV